MDINKTNSILSYIIKIIALLTTLIILKSDYDYAYAYYIIISLLLMANALIRTRLLHKNGFFISIIAEIIIICIMSLKYEGYLYLLFFTIILDAAYLRLEKMYFILIINLLAMVYAIFRQGNIEIIYILLLYGVQCLLTILLCKSREKTKEVEGLYDEIRRYSYELEGARNMLLDYSKKVEQIAQLEERDRISREIHDTIGHKLTGVFMQSELAIKALNEDKDDGIEIVKDIRDNIKNSIEVLRNTVKKLKPEIQNYNVAYIKSMISDFQKNTGISISYNVSGNQFELGLNEQVVLYKNIQEALTNAVRHGMAKNIWVNIDYGREYIVLTVKDDGIGCINLKKGMGIGQMETRAEVLGGYVEYISDNGFSIITKIPVNREQ